MSTTIFLLHCNECYTVIFVPHAVICKHSNHAVTSHKANEMNGNDGMTASACHITQSQWDEWKWWHDCICLWGDFGCENSVVQTVGGEMAACVTCGDSFCVFMLSSSCGNCMWSTEPTVSQYYIITCNIIIIIYIHIICLYLILLCFYLILFIMYSFSYVYVFLMLCMFHSRYCVSLCCSVYCLCVNVYCTIATGCQPNCS